MVDKQRKKTAQQKKLNGAVQESNESTLEISGHVRGQPDLQEQQQQEMAPGEALSLLVRIRRDRIDVEQRLEKVKDYITRTAEAMTKLKDKPEMADKYRRLMAARADLVRNAVSLRQLQERLSSSESRAMELVGENELANLPIEEARIEGATGTANSNENTSNIEVQGSATDDATNASDNTNESSAPVHNQDAPDGSMSISVEEKAQLEKRSQLVRKIVETERRTQELEVKRKSLDRIRNNLEDQIAETRAARLSLQRQADIKRQSDQQEMSEEQTVTDGESDPPESKTTTAFTSESLCESESSPNEPEVGQQNQTLASLHSRLATLHSLSESSTDGNLVGQLKDRLQYLDAFRKQMNGIIEQIEELKRSRLSRKTSEEDGVTGDRVSESASQTDKVESDFIEPSSVEAGEETSNINADKSVTESAELNPTSIDDSQHSEDGHTQHERRMKLKNLEADKEQLKHLKQLSEQLEEKKQRGEKLAQTSPEQLAQLIAASKEVQSHSDSFQSRTDAVSVVHGLQQAQRTINAVTEFTKK